MECRCLVADGHMTPDGYMLNCCYQMMQPSAKELQRLSFVLNVWSICHGSASVTMANRARVARIITLLHNRLAKLEMSPAPAEMPE